MIDHKGQNFAVRPQEQGSCAPNLISYDSQVRTKLPGVFVLKSVLASSVKLLFINQRQAGDLVWSFGVSIT